MNKYASIYINSFNKTAEDAAVKNPVAKPTASPLDYLLQAPPAAPAPIEQPPAAQLPSLGSPGELPLPQAPSLIGIPEPTTLNAGN